jgi:dUTP pyrophosphatase
MKVKIKKLVENAVIPKYAKALDAGMDLTVTSKEILDYDNGIIKYNFGIAVQIPKGHVGLLFARSSIYQKKVFMSNSVGVIDAGFIGEISAVMVGKVETEGYAIGDRAAQLIIIPYPEIEFEEVEELANTERGTGGFGSTN